MPSYALIKYRPLLPPPCALGGGGGTESTGGGRQAGAPGPLRMLTAGN